MGDRLGTSFLSKGLWQTQQLLLYYDFQVQQAQFHSKFNQISQPNDTFFFKGLWETRQLLLYYDFRVQQAQFRSKLNLISQPNDTLLSMGLWKMKLRPGDNDSSWNLVYHTLLNLSMTLQKMK